MTTSNNTIRLFSALALMSACAGGLAQTPNSDAVLVYEVPVYDSTAIAYGRYTVLRRIGVQGLQSAFWIPGHFDLESARRAVVAEAARLDADGVINLHCLNKTDAVFTSSAYYCYGNAIRLKNERRVAK